MSTASTTWEAAKDAIAHRSLRATAVKSGFDEDAVRHLLRVINAHPRLVAHAQVLGNLAALLDHIQTGAVGNPGAWAVHLDEWIRFCTWACKHRIELSNEPGLSQFDQQPRHANDNPHIGEGVDRHGVVAAIWCRHEDALVYPPNPASTSAWRYFLLQAHLVFSYIHARWQWVTLDAYEGHTGAAEWPVAPAPSSAAARAIRELSHSRYDQLLPDLDSGMNDVAFYSALLKVECSEIGLTDKLKERADSYLLYLKRFFKAALRLHKGRLPQIRHKKGGGGGAGSRERIPGYVHIVDTDMFVDAGHGVDMDTDVKETFGPMPGDEYWAPPKTEMPFFPADIEDSGLCPNELLEPVLQLVDEKDYKAAMYRARFAHLAREMATQSFVWDWSQLTDAELQRLWRKIESGIQAAYNNPPNKSKARYNQIAALLVKMMLLLGQPLERAHKINLRWVKPGETFSVLDSDEEFDELVLLVRGDAKAPLTSDEVIGFGLPPISPNYKSTQDSVLETVSRELAQGLVLPDVGGLGQQLLTFYRSERSQDQKLFHIDAPMATSIVATLLASLEEPSNRVDSDRRARITQERITRALPTLITQQTGEVTLAWMVTANTAHENEARMYYTMHSTMRLRSAYTNAAGVLVKKAGGQPREIKPDPTPQNAVHIGCRFVLSLPTLKELIASLKQQLTGRVSPMQTELSQDDSADNHVRVDRRNPSYYRDTSSLSALRQYDQHYLFYTYLVLVTMTGARAIIQPVSLFMQWLGAHEPRSGLLSGQWDKESVFHDKSRLVQIPSVLAQQFQHYRSHIEYLMRRFGQLQRWKSLPQADQLLVTFDHLGRAQPMTPLWVSDQFVKHLNVKVPCNFSRAFLRTELLERGVNGELVDAYLGHAGEGQSPFAQYSTFDYSRSIGSLSTALRQLADEIGLVALTSQIVPATSRQT